MEKESGLRLHFARVARTRASFFGNRSLDQTINPRAGFFSSGPRRFGRAHICLFEVSVDEVGCRHQVAQGLPQAIASF